MNWIIQSSHFYVRFVDNIIKCLTFVSYDHCQCSWCLQILRNNLFLWLDIFYMRWKFHNCTNINRNTKYAYRQKNLNILISVLRCIRSILIKHHKETRRMFEIFYHRIRKFKIFWQGKLKPHSWANTKYDKQLNHLRPQKMLKVALQSYEASKSVTEKS